MDIKIDIKPEDVEKAVVKAITESAIGNALLEIVEKSVKDMTTYSNSPLKKAINQEVSQIIMNTIREDFGDKIREAVRTKITDDVLGDVVDAAWNAFEAQLSQ